MRSTAVVVGTFEDAWCHNVDSKRKFPFLKLSALQGVGISIGFYFLGWDNQDHWGYMGAKEYTYTICKGVEGAFFGGASYLGCKSAGGEKAGLLGLMIGMRAGASVGYNTALIFTP